MYPESTSQLPEFRDTRFWFQYALGGIAGGGIVLTVSLYRAGANGNSALLIAAAVAAVATLVALAIVYLYFGKTVVLRQTEQGIVRSCGDKQQIISYEELAGFRSKWTDVLRNGVYQMTQIRFDFVSEDRSAPIMSYQATAGYGAPKFEELQQFQEAIAAVVADRMADLLEDHGRVSWTSRLAILPGGIEFKKNDSAAPELIGFERISKWTVDEGLLKLGVDEGSKPYLVEKTSEWNFMPGLLLLSRLCDSPGSRSTIDDEVHLAIS